MTVHDVDSKPPQEVIHSSPLNRRPRRSSTVLRLIKEDENFHKLRPGRTYSARIWRVADGWPNCKRRGIRFHVVPLFRTGQDKPYDFQLTLV